jgi:hypothetical protein
MALIAEIFPTCAGQRRDPSVGGKIMSTSMAATQILRQFCASAGPASQSPRARRTARIILKAAAPAPWQGHWKQLRVSAPRPSSRPLQRARSGRGLSRQHYGPRARHLRRLAEVKVARQLGAVSLAHRSCWKSLSLARSVYALLLSLS